MLLRQRPQGLTRRDWADGASRNGGRSAHGRRCSRNRCGTAGHSRCRRDFRCLCGLTAIGIVQRGIEQNGVLTHHAALGPIQLNQKVQIRFADRVTRKNPNVVVAFRIRNDFKFERQQDCIAGKPGPVKLARVGKLDGQGIKIPGLGAKNFDLSFKRLVQG